MRKILLFLFLTVFSAVLFAMPQAVVNRISLGNYASQMVFYVNSATPPKFEEGYDEFNKVLFVKIDNATATNEAKRTPLSGRYIQGMQVLDYGDDVGFSIKLKRSVGHKVYLLSNPYRIVVDLTPPVDKKEFLIAVDPGHGGKDSGATGLGWREKDLTLMASRRVAQKLAKDFKVIMTRNSDVFIKLSDRSEMANRYKADFFVSIHINSAENPSANGMEIFYFSKKSSKYADKIAAYENSFGERYGERTSSIAQIMGELAYNKNMEKSISVAKGLCDSMSRRVGMTNRGIYGANFAVLRGFNGPGMLVELGFINNRSDLTKMVNPNYQDAMAEEIANHIKQFFYK